VSVIKWFVNHGPDRSHLFNASIFGTKREARECAARMLMEDREAGRRERAYNIERAEYKDSNIWGDTVEFSMVEKNY